MSRTLSANGSVSGTTRTVVVNLKGGNSPLGKVSSAMNAVQPASGLVTLATYVPVALIGQIGAGPLGAEDREAEISGGGVGGLPEFYAGWAVGRLDVNGAVVLELPGKTGAFPCAG